MRRLWLIPQLCLTFVIRQATSLALDLLFARYCVPTSLWSLLGRVLVISPNVCSAIREAAMFSSKTGQLALLSLVSIGVHAIIAWSTASRHHHATEGACA